MRKTFGSLVVVLMLSPFLWGQESSSARVLMHRASAPDGTAVASAESTSVTVPAETEADIQLLSGVHTRVSHVNDRIEARLIKPVVIGGQVALPPGTVLDGRITRVRSSGRFHRAGELGFRFEQITLPDGESEPVRAVLAALDHAGSLHVKLDSEGYLKGTSGLSWKGITGGLFAFGAFGTAKLALAGAGAAWPILPGVGTGLLGYEFLWPRGHDVSLPPDTQCRIRLNYPVTVRVAW
ncbi:MAG: hypothetical protein ACLQOO_37395 [Terriglobia bacterium]